MILYNCVFYYFFFFFFRPVSFTVLSLTLTVSKYIFQVLYIDLKSTCKT